MAANLHALRILADLEAADRAATEAERGVLAGWSGWGAVPEIFDEGRDEWAADREQLRELLGDQRRWAQARRTTINAHYTHPAIARAVQQPRVARLHLRGTAAHTLPGLARTFEPRAHQRAAVARIIAEPAVGLFHQVGAGKTGEMIMAASELRRLGLVRKPAVVVPNHMLEQFAREWLQIYPQARVLAASSRDLAGEKRRRFVARAASNDWDAIILTRSAFERIPVNLDTQARYMEGELAGLREMLASAQAEGGRLTVKRVEKMVLGAEERLTAILDAAKDPGIYFEETGIDYAFVDFTSRPFRARLVRSRGCGAVWRTHRKPTLRPGNTADGSPTSPPRRPAVRSQPRCGRAISSCASAPSCSANSTAHARTSRA
jgi:N12 class adenine-specific DNA methylase